MKIAVLLLAVLSLTAAKPGGYHHQQYSFEQSSASYRNNELQHKNEEQGRYTKFEDLDSPDKPQESSVYHQSEYNAPDADKEHLEQGVKGHRRGQQSWQSNLNQRNLFKDSESQQKAVIEEDKSTAASYSVSENPDEGTTSADDDAAGTTTEPTDIESRWGYGGHSHHREHTLRYHGHTPEYHGHTREYHQGGHHQGGHRHGPGNRHFAWHNRDTPASSATGGHGHHGGRGYHSWQSTVTSSSNDRSTAQGFGRDYLENTEGGRTSSPTSSGGTRPDADSQLGGTTSTNTGLYPTVRPAVPAGTGTVDLQNVFGQIDSIAAETGQAEENRGRGMLDIRSGMHSRPNQPKISMRMHDDVIQHEEDLIQQTHDMRLQTHDLSQQTEDLTQQTQQSHDLAQHTEDLTQQNEDLTQQTQDGFSALQVASQYQQQSNQKHDHLDELTQQQQQQSEEGFGKLELGQQQTRTIVMPVQRQPARREHYRTVVQKPTSEKEWPSMSSANQQQQEQHQLDDLTQQQSSDLTQQHQDGFGTLEVGSQYQQQQQQQQRSDKLEDLTQQHGDLTQQTQDGFSGFEFGSQQHGDLTQQTQDLTQQTQDLTQQSQDLTQQTQDLTQQSQDLTQQHEDLTQQTQDGFGKLEFGQQQEGQTRVQHTMSENTRPTGRHVSEHGSNNPNYKLFNEEQYQKFIAHSQDLVQQQSNSGFDKIEVEDVTGQQHQSHSPKSSGKLEQHEDLTQQSQDGFGTLETGSQHQQQQQSQQRADKLEDLTQQQSQDGTFEFGSQYQQQSNQNQDKLDLTQQQHADLTQQQTQDKLGKLEFGVQHHQDMTQQHEDLTQQHQDGFSTLEIGSQYQQQQSQHKSDKMEDLTQQHEDLTQQHEDLTQQHQDGFGTLEIGSQYQQQQQSQQKSEDLTQQHSDLTQQHEDLTQQTQDGFGTFEIGSQYQQQSQHKSDNLEDLTQQHEDLTQQHEDLTQQTQDGFGQLELGQQRGSVQNGDWRTRHYQQQHSEQRSHSQSSTSSSSQYHQSSSHLGQLNYAHVGHAGADETTGELVHGAADHQHAQQVEDVSQHVQRVADDIKFDDQKENLEDFNQRSTQEILAKKHDEDETLQGRDVHHEAGETEKPGFWKRVGSSVAGTYENAKEKSKTFAEQVRARLG